jgi:ABC-2 type transport system ATP-binding protein
LLLGLISPSSGTAEVFGKDIQKESIAVRLRIGYLPQEINFYDYMTAREILNFTAQFFIKGPKQLINKRVNEMLKLVNLENKADRPVKGFSRGEKQRLGIAQAEINYPDILILDEPAASLDPIGRRDVLQVMEELRNYATIFYSTHILDDVEKVSDTVAILDHGELIVTGSIEELLSNIKNMVYSVEIQGDINDLKKRLMDIDWIEEISHEKKDNSTMLSIIINNSKKAEASLLNEIQKTKNLAIIHFSKKQSELEDIFFKIIKISKNTI